MPKDRRSRDQKRRAKLAKKRQKSRKAVSLAYMGEKFKTEELIPTLMHAEIGIYESYVITDRKLTDSTVVTALETLIKQLRAGTLPAISDTDEVEYNLDEEQDLVVGNIRRNWERHFEEEWQPPKDKLIGILRTILGSIEKMRAPGPHSQTFMRHIAGFLTKKLGVSVKQLSADMKPLPEPADDKLVRLGHQWILENDQDAKADFYELASDLIKNGQADRVIDDCHQIIGEESDPSSEAVAELMALSIKARRSLITTMG